MWSTVSWPHNRGKMQPTLCLVLKVFGVLKRNLPSAFISEGKIQERLEEGIFPVLLFLIRFRLVQQK